MLTLSTRAQVAVGILLAALMIVTRGQHFPDIKQALPSASWAVFFLAGVYLRALWVPAIFFGLAFFLDMAAVNWQGVSDYCVSPAYVALIPAYGALWLGGRLFAGRYAFKPVTLLWLFAAVLVSAFVCDIISSGAFYYFSGRFPEPTFDGFVPRVVKYYPMFLSSMAFWVATATAAHTAIVATHLYGAKSERA